MRFRPQPAHLEPVTSYRLARYPWRHARGCWSNVGRGALAAPARHPRRTLSYGRCLLGPPPASGPRAHNCREFVMQVGSRSPGEFVGPTSVANPSRHRSRSSRNRFDVASPPGPRPKRSGDGPATGARPHETSCQPRCARCKERAQGPADREAAIQPSGTAAFWATCYVASGAAAVRTRTCCGGCGWLLCRLAAQRVGQAGGGRLIAGSSAVA